MKKYIMIGVLVLGTSSLIADDSGAKMPVTKTQVEKTTPYVSKKLVVDDMPFDRTLEIRIGPRLSFLTGEVKSGRNGTSMDIWDDVGMDEPSAGMQFDVDWQFAKRWHAIFDMTWDRYDHSGVTSKLISNGDAGPNNAIAAGSSTSANLDIYTFEGRIGYDIVKTKNWTIMPYIAGKGGVADGTVSVTDNGPGGSGRVLTYTDNQAYALPLGGLDVRFYATPKFYVGADIGASGWENYFYLTGQAYTGYDFTKNFGVRVGYDANFVHYENDNRSTKADPLLGAAYVQAVIGF
jgi:hypothetical protein